MQAVFEQTLLRWNAFPRFLTDAGRKTFFPSGFLSGMSCPPKHIRKLSKPFFCANRPSHFFLTGNLPFPGIDPDKRTSERLTKVPDGRDGLSGSDFQDDRTGSRPKPLSKKEDLLAGSLSDPLSVSEHQDVRSCGSLAERTLGRG